jgi:hypothetical protein
MDNHQFYNARAFEATGAACLLEQKSATADTLVQLLLDLIEKPSVHEKMRIALAQWHAPHAAERIAEAMLVAARAGAGKGCCDHSDPAATPGFRAPDIRSKSHTPRPSQADRVEVRDAAGRTTAVPERRAA